MIGKLLNFGKKDQFFLELKEGETTEASAPAKAAATAVQPEAKPVAKEEVSPKAEPAAETSAPETATTTEAPVKSAKRSKKSKKGKKSQKSAATAPAPKPVAIDTSYSEEPFWVKLMYKTSEQKAAEQNAGKTFATDYLIAKPKSSRRPGGSVDKFKTMARQTKVRF